MRLDGAQSISLELSASPGMKGVSLSWCAENVGCAREAGNACSYSLSGERLLSDVGVCQSFGSVP